MSWIHSSESSFTILNLTCHQLKCIDYCPIEIIKRLTDRRVAEIRIFEKTYLIVIKDETGLKFKMNDSTLFLIGSYAQKLVASY